MLRDLARARFNEATIDCLVAVAVFGLPYLGCPFATVPGWYLGATVGAGATARSGTSNKTRNPARARPRASRASAFAPGAGP
jgi:hypothetical protein